MNAMNSSLIASDHQLIDHWSLNVNTENAGVGQTKADLNNSDDLGE